MNTKNIGNLGEKLAITYLQSKGYKILKNNWYCNHGEIDIIAKINDILVFVEVKYRKNDMYITVLESFAYKKRLHLRRSIGIFLSTYKLQNLNYQVDLLYISSGKISHYKNVLLN